MILAADLTLHQQPIKEKRNARLAGQGCELLRNRSHFPDKEVLSNGLCISSACVWTVCWKNQIVFEVDSISPSVMEWIDKESVMNWKSEIEVKERDVIKLPLPLPNLLFFLFFSLFSFLVPNSDNGYAVNTWKRRKDMSKAILLFARVSQWQ